MDVLGSKAFSKSINTFDTLLINGVSIIPMISNLSIFFYAIINSYSSEEDLSSFRLNNTIKGRINKYKKNYSLEELSCIIIELRNIDVLSKTSSANVKLLFHPFIFKICRSLYGSQ